MPESVGMRWGRIVVGALLAEVGLFVVAVPLNLIPGGLTVLLYSVLPLCLVATFLGGWWAARKAGGRFVWHGLLVGVLAALLYGALTWKTSLPTVYVVANYLKLAGGAAGGLLAQHLASKPAPLPSAA
jgi:putative membrane protein (TIGR04086 family)